MIIDCDSCPAQNLACDDCVVNLLLDQAGAELTDDEWQALYNLSQAGLISEVQFLRPPPPLFLPEADAQGA